MQNSTDPKQRPVPPSQEDVNEDSKGNQQQSDPPLTEVKGVTDPDEYIEPKVEDEPDEEGWEVGGES